MENSLFGVAMLSEGSWGWENKGINPKPNQKLLLGAESYIECTVCNNYLEESFHGALSYFDLH